MDYIFSIGIVLAIFITVVISGVVSDKRQEKRFRERLRKEFGKEIKMEYSKERFSCRSGYFDAHRDNEDLIDDITWNDLEGDRIYRYINHSYSDLLVDINCFGTGLYSLGLENKRIAVIGHNSYEWVVAHLANLLRGYCFCPFR